MQGHTIFLFALLLIYIQNTSQQCYYATGSVKPSSVTCSFFTSTSANTNLANHQQCQTNTSNIWGLYEVQDYCGICCGTCVGTYSASIGSSVVSYNSQCDYTGCAPFTSFSGTCSKPEYMCPPGFKGGPASSYTGNIRNLAGKSSARGQFCWEYNKTYSLDNYNTYCAYDDVCTLCAKECAGCQNDFGYACQNPCIPCSGIGNFVEISKKYLAWDVLNNVILSHNDCK